jgi:hypothetical protein
VVEHVRTAAGVARFDEPIGSPIVRHERAKIQTPSAFRHPFTGASMGKTEIGDTFEELFQAKGAHLLEKHFGAGPYAAISHADTDVAGKKAPRNTPLDFRLNAKYGGELKTLNANAKNQKTAIKADEIKRKIQATQKARVDPLLAVQVVDMEKGEVNVYAYPGFVSKHVTAMEHVGSYTFSKSDFKKAQEASGQWAKSAMRAAQEQQKAGAI